MGNALETHLSMHPSNLFSRTCRVHWQREAVGAEAPEAKTGESPRVAESHRAALGRDRSVGRETRGGRKRRDGSDPSALLWCFLVGRLSDVTGPLAGRRSQKNPKAACPEIPRALFRSLAIWSSTPASILARRNRAPLISPNEADFGCVRFPERSRFRVRLPERSRFGPRGSPRTKPIWVVRVSPNEADLGHTLRPGGLRGFVWGSGLPANGLSSVMRISGLGGRETIEQCASGLAPPSPSPP